MTAAELDALKALADAATPGPWHGDGNSGRVKYSVYGANEALVLRVDHKNAESGFLGDNAENDEAFVLAARAAVPALLAEVERLRAELADVLEIAIARGDSLGYESMDYCERLERLRPDSEILTD